MTWSLAPGWLSRLLTFEQTQDQRRALMVLSFIGSGIALTGLLVVVIVFVRWGWTAGVEKEQLGVLGDVALAVCALLAMGQVGYLAYLTIRSLSIQAGKDGLSVKAESDMGGNTPSIKANPTEDRVPLDAEISAGPRPEPQERPL